jgi:TatD DNase family protein
MLFDSHCHLTDEAFADDRDLVLERARAAGVDGLVTIASGPRDAEAALALARAHGGVWSTAGVHPHEAQEGTPAALDRVRALLGEPEVVAIGECGLDFHYDHAPRATQRATFGAQIELAADTGMPLVVHSRDADEDMAALLRSLPGGVQGVLHCFTGGDALLDAALEAGWWVSFSGIVTFKRFDAAGQVRAVPDDRLLVETDAPYLAPVPHRGRRNEPGFVAATAEALARLRGRTVEDIATLTATNARRFYGLDPATHEFRRTSDSGR